MQRIFGGRTKSWKSLDYVAGWFMKAADYGLHTPTVSAFVSTNSICQGQQVPILWPLIFKTGHEIAFAHTSFKWKNLASHNAGVTVAIVAISNHAGAVRKLFTLADDGGAVVKEADNINAYLVAAPNVIVDKASTKSTRSEMLFGNMPRDGGHLLLSQAAVDAQKSKNADAEEFILRFMGSEDMIKGNIRYCIWITDDQRENAAKRLIPLIPVSLQGTSKNCSEPGVAV